jgi:hypothetical protein
MSRRKKKEVVDVVVPFKHVLVAVLDSKYECPRGASCADPPDHRVCSTLDLAKQTLANHPGTGSVEAWGIDGSERMVLWGKSLGWRRCPVKHLEQLETEYTLASKEATP